MTSRVFHDGERAVQARAGVAAMAERIGRSIRRELPPAAQAFLAERRWIVLGGLDEASRPRIGIRAGAPGFAQSLDARTVQVDAPAPPGDPLDALLQPGAAAGSIALYPSTRRRLRLNGHVVARDRDRVIVEADQVFSNCPKYIQRRDEVAGEGAALAAGLPETVELSAAQRVRILAADTFFIASARPGDGVDVSHRGGMPGFVQVDGQRLSWPDYSGNAMFTTLGNLHAHPYAALLVPDFDRGGALIVTGRTTIDWTADPAIGAGRVVRLDVDGVVEQTGVLPLAFRLREYSPFNPR
jgi:predicted pyridoxine 5'-phosphate oxidase superfamily flavin-nucleotide-binding protein